MKGLLVAAFISIGVVYFTIGTHVQSVGAQDGDPEAKALDVCWQAVVKEARGKFAADGVEEDGDPHGWQESNAETGVRGKGVAVTPSGARTKFKYKCTYNIRSGETYGVEIRAK